VYNPFGMYLSEKLWVLKRLVERILCLFSSNCRSM
jgi:hypothetical protein